MCEGNPLCLEEKQTESRMEWDAVMEQCKSTPGVVAILILPQSYVLIDFLDPVSLNPTRDIHASLRLYIGRPLRPRC